MKAYALPPCLLPFPLYHFKVFLELFLGASSGLLSASCLMAVKDAKGQKCLGERQVLILFFWGSPAFCPGIKKATKTKDGTCLKHAIKTGPKFAFNQS